MCLTGPFACLSIEAGAGAYTTRRLPRTCGATAAGPLRSRPTRPAANQPQATTTELPSAAAAAPPAPPAARCLADPGALALARPFPPRPAPA